MRKSNVVKFARKPVAKVATKTVTVKAHTRVIKTKRTKVAIAPAPKPTLFVDRGLFLAHTSVSSVPVQITAETEKAWLFTAIEMNGMHGRACWFPKSAIEIVSTKGGVLCKLATWFRPRNGYVYRWLDYNAVENNILAKIA